MRALARILLTGLLLCSPEVLPAQGSIVHIQLAADRQQIGPTAWTFVRESILPSLPQWPEGLDPFSALEIELRAGGSINFAQGRGLKTYLEARVGLPGGTSIESSCDASGKEIWEVRSKGKLEARLDQLLTLLDIRHERNLIRFDVGAATGNLMAGTTCGDPMHSLLTNGAVECGELDLAVFREERGWIINGRSAGGLLLPAMLTFFADWQRHPTSAENPFAARPLEEIDRWLLLAAAGRGSIREEAARQLARFDSPAAVRGLEQLLHSEGPSRQVAMASLIRRGERKSLDKILASAAGDGEESAELAAYAEEMLGPEASFGSSEQASQAWMRPSLWLLLIGSSLIILARMFSSRRS
ncbi:MAG: HEAT repeat domain-containing protein [Planctomycetota bacterium]|jgi:hypothetical protein